MKKILPNFVSVQLIFMIFFLMILSNIKASSQTGNSEVKDSLMVLKYTNMLNSGERRKVQEYITIQYDFSFLKKLPIDIHVNLQMGFYYMSAGAGYDFIQILKSRKDEIKAMLLNKFTGAPIELYIPLKEEKINNFIQLKSISSKNNTASSKKLNDDEIIERIKKCLTLLDKNDEFSGAVLVARNGKSLFKESYGLANKADLIPNHIDTKFNIASVGKMFTAVAIAQLVEQGKLSFTDPLNKYLPADWLSPEISNEIQIRHLLTHTSGLGDYFDKIYSQCEKFYFSDLNDYKILTAHQTLSFEPGSKWSYSNTGMLLLGVVIEKITGMNYFDYLNKYIFLPADMKNTGDYAKNTPVPNRAIGYYKEYANGEFKWRDNSISRVLTGSPSGGCYSTVEDLLNFDIALRTNKLLGAEMTKEVLSAKPEINSTFYGYGFFLNQTDAGLIAEHSGDGTGISTHFRMFLASGYTVVVLSNYGRPAADIIDSVISQLLIERN
jgi:CubicO group peptidase (beta-lactamase class C family)